MDDSPLLLPDDVDPFDMVTADSLAVIVARPERVGAPSAWWEHVPFGRWAVAATRPRLLVELGVHAGVSYSAFCEAVLQGGLDTRCFAVDTWRGDAQAGEYGEEVFDEFLAFHDAHYRAFSTLLRTEFDDACNQFGDGSIDFLHIDGFHSYEAVAHDFERWRPKLSARAVVLFHDTNERRDGFGVWRFWTEIREQFPWFEFLHGHGLGVLAYGHAVDPAIAKLCTLTNAKTIATIRGRFATLGDLSLGLTRERMLGERLGQGAGRLAAAEARVNGLAAEVEEQARRIATSEEARAALQVAVADSERALQEAAAEFEGRASRIAESEEARAALQIAVAEARRALQDAVAESEDRLSRIFALEEAGAALQTTVADT